VDFAKIAVSNYSREDKALCCVWMVALSSRARSFLQGLAVSVCCSAAVYLGCDAISDAIILRECHKLVLPLASKRDALVEELGEHLEPGPMFSSTLRSSPTGNMVQCQFRLDGSKRSSDVTATVCRPPYATNALYNLWGPREWELRHCHVLVGK
jgi:hypothetical protein